jgi:lysyl endopeptidase
MWLKKTVIPLCSAIALFTSPTLSYSAEADIVSVPASPGPVAKQRITVEQQLRSELPATTFSLIALEPLAVAKTQAMKEQVSLPTQIGLNRNIAMLSNSENTVQQLNWHRLQDNGHSATIQIHSSQAYALRVGMTVNSLPENAELRFFSMNEGTAVNIQLVPARQILAILQKNRAANPDDPNGRIFWAPTVNGDTLGMEIYLPEEYDPSSVEIAFPLISHISSLPFGSVNIKNSLQGQGDSDPCQNDATCTTTWLDLGNSVAGMQFSTNDGTYVCTGSLLNDSEPDTWEPYFLTANHCISTQAVASSLETHWFWQSSSCNSGVLSASYKHHMGGATLLHTQGMDAGIPTSSSMDTTLLHLNTAPPVGAVFAGWTTAVPPGFGTARVGIHHPKADWKMISFGLSSGDLACGWADASGFLCVYGAGNFYGVDWTNGGTEGGSSGSSLYFNTEQVMGTLSGGDGSCAGSTSLYSSFRAAFAAGNYEQWLYTVPPEPELPAPVVAPTNFLLLR